MRLEPQSPADLSHSRLAWRLAAPSLAASLALLAIAILAAVSLFVAHRAADDDLDRVVKADQSAEQLTKLLEEFRALLKEHAREDGLRDTAWMEPLLAELRRHTQQGLESRDVRFNRSLLSLDNEIGILLGSPSPQLRLESAYRIINDFLEPELLEIAKRERILARQDFLEAQAYSRRISTWTGWTLLFLGVAGAGVGALSGYNIAKTLRQRLVELRVPIQTASGSLDAVIGPVEVRSGADVEDIEESLNSLASRVSDVVQRLQSAERESLRNDQLASLGQLAAGLAHELRNPLTAIRTLVEAARAGGPAAQLDGRDLEVVDEELTRLDSTLQSFLDYARPPKLERRSIDLRDVIDRTVLLVKPRAEQQSVKLDVELPTVPVRVNADPEQLRQVVLNLLLNALDALGSGGRIEVGAQENPAQRHATLMIADNGPGIPAALRDKLFEPFVSSKASGTGLGLTICRRIVENHGGTITVDNRPTGGAVFTIQLPAEVPTENSSTIPTPAKHSTAAVPALASS
jgi:two-component system, NtrC family, sensor histidine kinase HydH